MKFTVRGRKKEDLNQILEHAEYSFGEPREVFIPQLIHYPDQKPENTRLGYLDNLLVTSVQVVPKTLYARGTRITLGGIANVGTLPAFRRRGFSDLVLKDTIEYMKKNGMQISGLYTGSHNVYRPHGYEIWHQANMILSLPGNAKAIHQPRNSSIVPFENKHLNEVMNIYHTFCQTLTAPVSRTKAYWEAQLKWKPIGSAFFWVMIDNSNKVQGYIRGKIDLLQSTYSVLEACGELENKKLWDSFSQKLIKECQLSEDYSKLQLISIFKHHPLHNSLIRMGCKSRSKGTQGLMMRILDLKSITSTLLPILLGKLRASEVIVMKVQIKCPLDSATIEFAKEKVKVSNEKAAKQIYLSNIGLMQWLLGRHTLTELIHSDEENRLMNITSSELRFLDALLPKTSWTYWNIDDY